MSTANGDASPVTEVGGDDILLAASICRDFLGPQCLKSWDVPVPSIDGTVARVVAHAAEGPLWYGLDLWSGPADDAAFEVHVKRDAPNAAILVSLMSAALVCAASVDSAPATARGFHPAGSPDPSGFAAMACDELIIHTHDAARGLGLAFRADGALAGRVLRRLFPLARRRQRPLGDTALGKRSRRTTGPSKPEGLAVALCTVGRVGRYPTVAHLAPGSNVAGPHPV